MAEITIRQPQVAVKFGAGKFQVTDFRAVTESRGALSWAVCITNIDWRK